MQSSKQARDGIADVTIDKEQVKAYESIVELLLAAGYFRARIPVLSQFDKIVGGLAWCITASNVDLDIDLFFEEDAQIRQKLYVLTFLFFFPLNRNIILFCPTESLVKTLRGLWCK